MNKYWATIIIVVLLIVAIVLWRNVSRPAVIPNLNPPATTTADNTGVGVGASVMVGAGEHCGGNMANAPTCATGYHCAPQPGSSLPFGDVGGTCVPN